MKQLILKILNKLKNKINFLGDFYYYFFFKTNLIKKPLIKDNKNISEKDLEFIKRICEFYIFSFNRNNYSNLGLWDKIFHEKTNLKSYKFINKNIKCSHSKLHNLLIDKNYIELHYYLKNFGSLEISSGLSTTFYSEFFYRDFYQFNKSIKNKSDTNLYLSKKNNNSLGGLNVTDNEFIPCAGPRTIYAAEQINNTKKKSILEIGSGFGLLPYYLYEKFNFRGSYVNIDLPIISILFAVFINKNLSDNVSFKFINELNNEDKINISNLKNTIVCADHKFFFENKTFYQDLIVNIDSFSEFSNSNLKNFLNRLSFFKKSLFLSINHELEYKFYNPEKQINEKHQNLSKVIENSFVDNYKLIDEKKLDTFDRNTIFYQKLYEIK